MKNSKNLKNSVSQKLLPLKSPQLKKPLNETASLPKDMPLFSVLT